MENNNLTVLKDILLRHIISVVDKIQLHVSKNGKLNSGAWINKTNTIMAYLSYYPNDDFTENSIDATIELTVINESANFSANICWSDGKIIADIMNTDFAVVSLEQLRQEVDSLGQLAANRIVKHFLFQIDHGLLE
ncbi:MAG: hypothetical protein IAE79_22925 [Anaerolinea sp.]|nr:hypothetical protein [Anaerolinea sp.]